MAKNGPLLYLDIKIMSIDDMNINMNITSSNIFNVFVNFSTFIFLESKSGANSSSFDSSISS